MTANPSAVTAPPREDAPHCPALAARPLTLRAWPSHATSVVNDNCAAEIAQSEIDWERFVQAAPATAPTAEPPPPSRRDHRVILRDAAYGLAGAGALFIAAACLIAR